MNAQARGDDGMAAVFVAVLLIALLALVALAVDAGALYAERRELQSGADAAVLAIAEDCGKGLPCDNGTAMATAETYADANARDLLAGVDELALDTSAQTVRVITRTEEAGGATIFAPFFAQVIGFPGTKVRAHAAALWGYPVGGATIPIILSDCEWDKLDKDPAGGYDEYTFFFHDGKLTPDCPSASVNPGHDADGDGRLPGGFGWLDTGGDDCVADVLYDAWVGADPGASPSNGCSPDHFFNEIYLQEVTIPWYDDYDGTGGHGANGGYFVSGIGGFFVTGYNFGGLYKAPSAASAPCKGDKRCIRGHYTPITDTEGPVGGQDRGVLIVRLTE